MITYLVAPETVAILFAKNETVEPRRAVADCLRRNGLDPWKNMEAESYQCGGSVLLLARPAGPRTARIAAGRPRLSRRG